MSLLSNGFHALHGLIVSIGVTDAGKLVALGDKGQLHYSMIPFTLKKITAIDSPYTASDEYTLVCDSTSGDITIILPDELPNKIYHIKKNSIALLNNISISPTNGLIEGELDINIRRAGDSLTIQSDGTDWHIL